MDRVQRIIERLCLRPHPEGGYYRETYRSSESISQDVLPSRYRGARSFGTAIYYLLTAGIFSAIHRVKTDEIWHFYCGDPVEILQLLPDGSGLIVPLGSDIERGMQPQAVVPRGAWQGARLVDGGEYALLGTTVAPGFEFTDFELGCRDELMYTYAQFKNEIAALTRE